MGHLQFMHQRSDVVGLPEVRISVKRAQLLLFFVMFLLASRKNIICGPPTFFSRISVKRAPLLFFFDAELLACL